MLSEDYISQNHEIKVIFFLFGYSFYNIFISWIKLYHMLPSMRYDTGKLSELFYRKKSFQDHRSEIRKIKNKQNNTFNERQIKLNDYRQRMMSSFNYTQKVRQRSISKGNYELFQKCTGTARMNLNNSHQQTLEKVKTPRSLSAEKNDIKEEKMKNKFLLKNHRNSPIHKTTQLQRKKQNYRLTQRIQKPLPSINTEKLEKVHNEMTKYKKRIMKYSFSELKSERYLKKRLSSTSRLKNESYQKSPYMSQVYSSQAFHKKEILKKKQKYDKKDELTQNNKI